MGFFDLNIPYNESNKRNPTTEKSIRLKLAVKAMELGYTGVAYNRTITGVMSEADRCSISLFPISSVLKVSPSISASVNLHRRLLNVPTSTPFRQYTRLTVVVDTPAQGSALNSGNPVLKTYDIIAVRPLKQDSFDQSCKNYEVDIIAIDFSENRFRLKQPLIKAAIERGVYFEITYSGLVLDVQLRRQMITNAKLLVDWTRGKNLIFSSAAPSVTELRGPYDVANLASLLGLSVERAKAAVSRTCRSLLENGIRKKKFYKEAIRVELITSDIEGDGFDDWLKWDPISSGEGDLQLDDMAKSFADSNKESKTMKPIDFASIIAELPSHGLQIKDMVPSKLIENSQTETQEKGQNGNFDILSANETVEEGETCGMVIEEEVKIPIDVVISEENVNDDIPATIQCEISSDKYLREEFMEGEHMVDTGDVEGTSVISPLKENVPEEQVSALVTLRPQDELQNENIDSVIEEQLEDMSAEIQQVKEVKEIQEQVKEEVKDDSEMNQKYAQESSSVERVRRKQRSSPFPFKRLLKTSQFKKTRKHKAKSTILSLSELIG
ncbi:hypothetical protein LXL04_000494 [Taraxacum kok-saghyz]